MKVGIMEEGRTKFPLMQKGGRKPHNFRDYIPNRYKAKANDIYEQLGKFSDSTQAAIKGHPDLKPMGHSSSYFSSYDSQLDEIIAHSSENIWIGNPIFKQIAPDLYNKMRELIAKKLGVKP